MGCHPYTSFLLNVVSRIQQEAKTKLKFRISKAQKMKIKVNPNTQQNFIGVNEDNCNGSNCMNLLSKNDDSFMFPDTRSFHYEVLVANDDTTSRQDIQESTDLVSKDTLPCNAESKEACSEYSNSLFENQFLSDVILVTNDKEIFAHKAILASSSPVFFAMFSHQTQENLQNRVFIEDIEYEVLREMLRFVYTGKVSNIKRMASSLFAAADKYELQILREMCEEVLPYSLSIENASDIVILADAHNANMLKRCAINFINAHSSAVTTTPGWITLYEKHPRLIADAYLALIKE